MSDGIYKIITCDRCGLEIRIEKSKADQMATRLPKNWGAAPGKAHEADLCPRCFSEFKILVANFMEEVKIRSSLMNKLNELNGAIVNFNVASQRAERAQEDAREVYSKMQDLIYPLQKFIDTHPEIGDLGDSMKAIATYKGMLEATKDVFGDSLSDEVMSASIEAASYGAWRTIMGEAQPTAPRKRY